MTRSIRFTCVLWEKRTEIENEIMKMYTGNYIYASTSAPLRPQNISKIRPKCACIGDFSTKKLCFSEKVAIFMLNVDEFWLGFREHFQKVEKHMEIYRMLSKFAKKI